IIENEGGIRALRDGHESLARPQDVRIGRVFEPQLQARDVAARERALQVLREGLRVELRRRNQIKPAARLAHAAFSTFSSSGDQPPCSARPFMRARWMKAR